MNSSENNSTWSSIKLSELTTKSLTDRDAEWYLPAQIEEISSYDFNDSDSTKVAGLPCTAMFGEVSSSYTVSPKVYCSSIWSTGKVPETALMRGMTSRELVLPTKFKAVGRKDIFVTLLWISCGWILLALDWTLYFIREYNEKSWVHPKDLQMIQVSNSTISSELVPTANPSYFEYEIFQGDSRDLVFVWTKLCIRALLFIPLASTIYLSIFTNLNSFKGKTLAKKFTIIYVTQIVIGAPFAVARLKDLGNLTVDYTELIAGTTLFHLVLMLEWSMLVKFLSMEWRINFKWLPAFQLCQAVLFISTGMPLIVQKDFLDAIVVFVPLIILILELVIKKVWELLFEGYMDNNRGLILSMAFLIFPMEVSRFSSFLLLFMLYQSKNAPFSHILLSAAFSVIGEIYTHTDVQKLATDWIRRRFVGWHEDDLPEVYKNYASVRSLLEIVAPTFIVTNILMANACLHYLPIVSKKWNFIFFEGSGWLMRRCILAALVTYYIVELISIFVCFLISKLTSQFRISAVGSLKWSDIFTMIVFVGTAGDVAIAAYGFIRFARGKG